MSNSILSLILVTVSICAGQLGLAAQNPVLAIVPQPVKAELAGGVFVIDENTVIVADAASMPEARKLQDCLGPAMGFRLRLVENGQSQG
ncbi:MAG: glycoside hydrolase family 20 zincin-like fold domain-containing protein, partial [Phycisphaerae bacterium]